jgi:hypothetical protein
VTTTSSTPRTFRTGTGSFPKNLEYLWKHPDLSQKTKKKIAYHNGREYFQFKRPAAAQAVRKAN